MDHKYHTMFLSHVTDFGLNSSLPLTQFDNRKILVKGEKYKLFSNICPHQGSIILPTASKEIACQYHGWQWNLDGSPKGSGNTKICNNFQLPSRDAFVTNSLIFDHEIELSSIQDVDFSFMKLTQSRVDIVNTDYRNIIDIFLDVDHIPVVHSSIYESIGVETDVEWKYYDWGSIQLVKKSKDYSKEFEITLKNMPQHLYAAAWITIYPYTTIEWQPGALFINVCIPQDQKTKVCVFKYRDERYSEKNWNINSSIWETAWEQDKQQSEAIANRSLFLPHLEKSKIHFRNWEKK